MNILITGASSGIGAALAKEYARRGDSLFLCGRDAARTAEVAESCRALGAPRAEAEVLDVTDAEAIRAWIARCDAAAPLDIIHANAGVSTGVEDEENVRRTFAVNVGGVLNTVLPAIDAFRKAKIPRVRKQIVITASIAGYRGLPPAPSYSATKACVKAWGAGLRGMLKPEGIRVNVVCPGFVRSRITDKNTCPMPFFWEADKAARVIVSRVQRDVPLIAFPWPMRLGAWLGACLPERLAALLYDHLPDKC